MEKKMTMSEDAVNELRKKVWNKKSVRNPIAKELLQGDGRLSAKVIKDKRLERELHPRNGKTKWLKELEEDELLNEKENKND